MTGTGTIGTRQQVERWIEESQYLLGRVIPSVFDDNQRLRERAAASDAECDRMREEIATVRRNFTRSSSSSADSVARTTTSGASRRRSPNR